MKSEDDFAQHFGAGGGVACLVSAAAAVADIAADLITRGAIIAHKFRHAVDVGKRD